MPRLGAKWCNQTSRSGLVASMVRTVDVTGSKPIGIPTKTVKMSLHSQPHCATATGFHDYLSIVSGETRSQTFQKMQFKNSNNGFCNRRGARVESKKNLTSRPFCESLKFETGGICLYFDFCDPAYRSVYISLGWLKRLHFRHARCFLLSSAYKQLGYGLLWSSTWKIHTTVSKLFSVSLIWTPRTYISTCRTQHFTMSACPGSC